MPTSLKPTKAMACAVLAELEAKAFTLEMDAHALTGEDASETWRAVAMYRGAASGLLRDIAAGVYGIPIETDGANRYALSVNVSGPIRVECVAR